jgi:hypothetical protein
MANFTRTIAADADDGQYNETGTNWDDRTNEGYPSGEIFEVQNSSGDRKWGAVRFLNLTVPVGATINTATLTINLTGVSSIDAAQSIITVFADVGANRTAALGAAHHPQSNWTNSTASVQHAGLAVGDEVVNVASLITELIALGSWASGNAACFGLFPDTNGSDTYWLVTIADYDADTSATMAELFVDYTEGGGGGGNVLAWITA